MLSRESRTHVDVANVFAFVIFCAAERVGASCAVGVLKFNVLSPDEGRAKKVETSRADS